MRRGIGERKTDFVEVRAELILDGEGRAEIETGLPFLDHMLAVFARAGLFDLAVAARGGAADRVADADHIVEGAGAAVGEALRRALGDRRAIVGCGDMAAASSEAVSQVVIEVAQEGEFFVHGSLPRDVRGGFEGEMAEAFFRRLALRAGITLHLTIVTGSNGHHILESAFKAVALALRDAAARVRGGGRTTAAREDLAGSP